MSKAAKPSDDDLQMGRSGSRDPFLNVGVPVTSLQLFSCAD